MARHSPEGAVPLLSVEGTSYQCGEQLGVAWAHSLQWNARRAADVGWNPWWWKGRGGVTADLVERIAPHLVDIFRGMASGAGIDEAVCGYHPIAAPQESCTSFAAHQDLTLDGHALTGQTKDTGRSRTFFYQVLRVRPTDGPAYLTLTYPGEFLGHGFSGTGVSVFRNSLYVTPRQHGGEVPFDALALLAVFSTRVDDVVEMALRHGVRSVGHILIADATGRATGLEFCHGRAAVVEGREGLYVHANHAVGPDWNELTTSQDHETADASASHHRQARLYTLMEAERGRLTPQLMLRYLSDHDNYPRSICSHRGADVHTSAAVVAEPGRGLLHVTRGAPCQNWPVAYPW